MRRPRRAVLGEPGEGRRREGECLHALLAGCRTLADLEEVLPLLGEKETETVKGLLRDERTKGLFDLPEGTRIRNEVPLVDERGGLHYVDRLIEAPDVLTVVEWKTGQEEAPEHVEQVKTYLRILRQAHPDGRIRGVLVYTAGPRLYEVEPV